jgi:uncharacterized protein YjiS (DUF1127 family)
VTDSRGAVPPRAFEGLRRRWRGARAAAERRKRIAELNALDDRTLQDIGVDRRAIPDLVDTQLQTEAEAMDQRPASARPGIGARPCAQPC